MIRSLFLVIVGFILTGISSLYVILAYPFFSKGPDAVQKVTFLWSSVLLKLASVKVEVIGRENILRNTPQIFMSNHQSWFDIFVLLIAVNTQYRFLAKKELFEVPVFGLALRKSGAIPIDRKRLISAMRSIDAAAKQIRQGTSVMTFPEGTRSKNGQILPFKSGVFYLALKAGAPIVPISIVGTAEIMPKQSLKVNPGNVTVVIGEPIQVKDYSTENMDGLIEKVSDVVCRNYYARKPNTTAK